MRDIILEKVQSDFDLPALPELLVKIEEFYRDESSHLDEVANLVSMDPVIAGRLISLANSVHFGAGKKEVSNLTTAVLRIGLQELRKIVYSMSLNKLFTDHAIIKRNDFWKHNLAVGILTQALAKRTGASEEEAETAYLAGLMHDVGIMIFIEIIEAPYSNFISKLAYNDFALDKQEKRIFGIDHAELGAIYISEKWQLSEEVISAIRTHHFPFGGDESQNRIAQLVNVANGLCSTHGISNGLPIKYQVFEEGAWLRLGLTLEEVDDILNEVRTSLNFANAMLV